MNNSITKLIKKQLALIDYNYSSLRKGISKLWVEINKQLKDEKLEKTEKIKLLEMRFDLKRIRNILSSDEKNLL